MAPRTKKSSHRGKRSPSTPRQPLERTCVATREKHPQEALLRVVPLVASLSPWEFRHTHRTDITIAVDWSGKLPGRSAWMFPSADAVKMAIERNAFQRSLKCALRLPTCEALLQHIQDGLLRTFLSRLSLARRAGALSSGQDPSLEAMKYNTCKLLLLSNDLSEAQERKLTQNAIRKGISFAVVPFDRDQLGKTIQSATLQQTTCIAVTAEPFATYLSSLCTQLHATCASDFPLHVSNTSEDNDLIVP